MVLLPGDGGGKGRTLLKRALPFGNLTRGQDSGSGKRSSGHSMTTTESRTHAIKCGDVLSLFPKDSSAPGRGLSNYVSTGYDNLRVCGQLDTRVSS